MQFYRVEDVEMLPEGVNVLTWFVLPEHLESFQKIYEPHRELHHLTEPELVEVEGNFEVGFALPEGEKNRCIIYGG